MTETLELLLKLLCVSVIFVPLFLRLGLGSVLGYLSAGLLIGPYGTGLINNTDKIVSISEFGIVFLMFIIGLELKPTQLWSSRSVIFGLGSVQVLVTTLITSVPLYFWLNNIVLSLLVGFALSLSSTALVLQLYREKGWMKSESGEKVFGILLFQDIIVIPFLSLLPLLAPSSAGVPAVHWGEAVLVLVAVVLAGQYLLGPFLRFIAKTSVREIFTAASLLIVIAVAYLMHHVGLSMTFGSFISGLILANTEFRHELEVSIEPFKGLFMGLFFLGVGLSLDLSYLINHYGIILLGVAVLVTLKFAALFAVGKMKHTCISSTSRTALALAQGGEFAFVLFLVMQAGGLLTADQYSYLVLVVGVSLFVTPIAFLVFERWNQRTSIATVERDSNVESRGRIIVAGFGRMGQILVRLLSARGLQLTTLDNDPAQIEVLRKFGYHSFYGDISRLDVLRQAGAEDADLLILAIDNMEAVDRTLELCKLYFPKLKVVARVRARTDAYRVLNLGYVPFRETFASALEMGGHAMSLLGHSTQEIVTSIQKFKMLDEGMMIKAAPFADDEDQLISMSTEAREELMKVLSQVQNPETLELKS